MTLPGQQQFGHPPPQSGPSRIWPTPNTHLCVTVAGLQDALEGERHRDESCCRGGGILFPFDLSVPTEAPRATSVLGPVE